jgi:hypothetical protein
MSISNNPPAHEAFALHIEELFALVSDTTTGGEVTTDEQDAALDALMDDLRKARKDADAERAAEKKPHDDAAAEVQTRWKPLLARCDMGVTEIKKLLTPYRDAKQKAKDEEARKAREEAAEREKAAKDALRSSDDLETRFAAEADLKQARKLTAVANKIDRSATGLRTRWTATVTDYKPLLRYAMDRRPELLKEWLADFADSEVRAGVRSIPGVEIKEEKVAA